MVNHTLLSRRVHTPVIFRSLAVMFSVGVGAATLTGCGATAAAGASSPCSAGQPPAAVVLVTATSAEPAPALPPTARAALARLGDADDACVAVAIGQHELSLMPLTPMRRNGRPEHGSRRAVLLQNNLTALDDALAGARETDPGLDLVAAIRTAARRTPSVRTIIVVSSGVTTREPMDLRGLGWALDPGPVVQRLAAAHDLPDLSGRQVTFAGLGDSGGRQPKLTPHLAQQLRTLCTAICRASGAARCEVDPTLAPDTRSSADNDVPIVALPTVTRAPTGFSLPGPLLFEADQAEVSRSARSALAEVTAAVLADQRQVVVIGRTDATTGTAEYNLRLSDARAHAVAAALEALGVPAQRISTVRGDGSTGFSAAEERAHPEQLGWHRRVDVLCAPAS